MFNKYYLDSLALLRIGGYVLAFVSNIWYVKKSSFLQENVSGKRNLAPKIAYQ